MISRLGWKPKAGDQDSDSSEGNDTDQAELDDFLSFSSIEDHSLSDPDYCSSDSDSCSSDTESCSSDSDSDTCSIAAPPFSPVMNTPYRDTLSDVTQQVSSNASNSLDAASSMPPFSVNNANETVTSTEADQLERPILHGGESNQLIHPVISNVPVTPVETSRPQLREDTSAGSSRVWNGFKLVEDNIDKNYRRSFHHIDKNTTSIHYFMQKINFINWQYFINVYST